MWGCSSRPVMLDKMNTVQSERLVVSFSLFFYRALEQDLHKLTPRDIFSLSNFNYGGSSRVDHEWVDIRLDATIGHGSVLF